MNNIPQVKLGIVAVSRDCFPIQLSQNRRAAVVAACAAKGLEVYEAQTRTRRTCWLPWKKSPRLAATP